MLQARQVRLHGVVRGRLSWAARDEARPVDAEQLADVGDVGPEGGDYLAEDLHWNEYVVTVINILVNGITEFLFQRFVVYGKNVDTAVKQPQNQEQ